MTPIRFHSRLLLALAGVLLVESAGAQSSVDARLGLAFDRLLAAGSSAGGATFEGAFQPQFQFDDQRGRVSYSLEGGNPESSGDWGTLRHTFGTRYRLDLGPSGGSLFLGGSADLQRNGEAWSEANYDAAQAFANWQGPRWGALSLRSGVSFTSRWFEQLSPLDQDEGQAFASALANFESRTTLIAEVRFGAKTYAGGATTEAPAAIEIPAASTGAGSPGQRGSGRGGQSASRLTSVWPTLQASAAHARQWTGLVRVAQGLTERTGLHLQASARRIGGDSPPFVLSTPMSYFDDGVYDDPFASDLDTLRAGLTHQFANGAELNLASEWRRQDFQDLPALDAAGQAVPSGEARSDRVWRGWGRIEWPLLAERSGKFELAMALDYQFTSSRSNDAFYEYDAHAARLSLHLSR